MPVGPAQLSKAGLRDTGRVGVSMARRLGVDIAGALGVARGLLLF